MEIHIAQGRDGNIYISDRPWKLEESPIRSYFMVFPPNGQQRDIYIHFDENDINLGSPKKYLDDFGIEGEVYEVGENV